MKSYLERISMFENPELSRMLREPYLASKQLITLIRRYKLAKNKDKKLQLRNEIFNNNVRFIMKCVTQRVPSENVEDVFNAAVVKFFEGLDRFKPNKGFVFQTYIKYWIDAAIYEQYISSNIVTIKAKDFFKKDIPEIYRAKNAGLNYLDKLVIVDGEEMDRMDAIDKYILGHNTTDRDQLSDDIKIASMAMSKVLRAHEILFLRLKYLYDPELSMKEMSKIFNLSVARVGQIINSALFKVRAYVESGGEIANRRWSYSSFAPSNIPSYTDEQMKEIYKKTIDARIVRKYKGKKT